MPKVSIEIDVTSDQLVTLMHSFDFLGLGKVTPIPPAATEETAPEFEPAKPAKKEKKAKAEKVEEAKAEKVEEPKAEKVEEPKAEKSALTLETVRSVILDVCKAIGTNAAIEIVEKVSGVRKAAQVDPSKFEAVIQALNEAKEQAAAVG